MKALNTYLKPIFTNVILPIAVTILGTLGYDYIKNVPLLSSLESSLNWIKRLLVSCLTYNIPLYVVVVIITLMIIIFRLYISVKAGGGLSTPTFLKYTTDRPKQWKWAWEYVLRNGKYDIINLRPYCLKCNYVLKYNKDSWGLCQAECPNCKSVYYNTQAEDIDDVRMMIGHRITENLYSLP